MKRVLCAAALALLVMTGCGPKARTANVEFSYIKQPATPLSEQHMQIAVRNANVVVDGDPEFDQKKWAERTADLIQYYLEQAKEQHRVPLKLVDREHVKLAMEEKDLASAGVTDSGDAVGSAQIKGANAIITSRINIKIDKQKAKKSTISSIGGWASGWGGGGGASADTRETESRNISVSSQFQLKDPATNDIITSFNAPALQDYTPAKRPSPFFGGDRTEANMTPRDQVVAEMLEIQVQKFMSKFVPTEVTATVAVKSSKDERSIEGVKAMLADDYEQALGLFKQILAEKSDDDESAFAAGVCCEKLKKMDEARKYYKEAASIKPKDPRYNEAVARVSSMG